MSEKTIVYNRAKTWQIAMFACNNTATNVFMFMMGLMQAYMNGVVGIAIVTVSMLLTALRVFDGITDPIIGFIIDRTDSKFGKFRPAMVLGYVIMVVTSYLLFHSVHLLPESELLRTLVFILLYLVYIIGYTFQTACTKAAQACLTNDPQQRPIFSLFDGVYNIFLFVGLQVYVANVLEPKHGSMYAQSLYEELIPVLIIISGILTLIAVWGIRKKDRLEFFGLGVKGPAIKFSDYIDVIKHNRAIQMLIFAASTDKLANTTMRNSIVLIIIFGVIAGDFGLSGTMGMITVVPVLLVLFVGIAYARKLGQKKALVVSTWASLVFGGIIGGMILFGDMNQLRLNFSEGLSLFTIVFLIVYILMGGCASVSANIVIPMIADCADYETYRTGRYIPGMMGTLFSFVDKLVSSLSTTIVGLCLAAIGYSKFPDVDTELTQPLLYVAVFLFIGMPMIGWISSLIAMKFYPLDAKKMEEVQLEIQKIKDKA